MKDGVCPKCKSEEIYVDDSGPHGIVMPLSLLKNIFTRLYACAKCGYLEFYIQNKQDIEKISSKFQKVKGNI